MTDMGDRVSFSDDHKNGRKKTTWRKLIEAILVMALVTIAFALPLVGTKHPGCDEIIITNKSGEDVWVTLLTHDVRKRPIVLPQSTTNKRWHCFRRPKLTHIPPGGSYRTFYLWCDIDLNWIVVFDAEGRGYTIDVVPLPLERMERASHYPPPAKPILIPKLVQLPPAPSALRKVASDDATLGR